MISPAVPELFDSPGFAFTTAIILNIKPRAANGMFIQLYAPRQGINPISMPSIDSIPQIRLKICMIIYFNELNVFLK